MEEDAAVALYRELGKNIRDARQRIGLNQEQLAEKIGLQRTSVTNVERGSQRLPVHTLYEVASALSVHVHDLLPAQEPTEGDHDMPESLRQFFSSEAGQEVGHAAAGA